MNKSNEALNAMLRCYDYGKHTTPAEWEEAAEMARKVLTKKPAKVKGFNCVANYVSKTMNSVSKEVMDAYADANKVERINGDGMRFRNLSFKASEAVSIPAAITIMKDACPSYNEFEPACLKAIPKDRKIFIAREGSPCVYVLGEQFTQNKPSLKADEFDFYPNRYDKDYGENRFSIDGPVTRIWWD